MNKHWDDAFTTEEINFMDDSQFLDKTQGTLGYIILPKDGDIDNAYGVSDTGKAKIFFEKELAEFEFDHQAEEIRNTYVLTPVLLYHVKGE